MRRTKLDPSFVLRILASDLRILASFFAFQLHLILDVYTNDRDRHRIILYCGTRDVSSTSRTSGTGMPPGRWRHWRCSERCSSRRLWSFARTSSCRRRNRPARVLAGIGRGTSSPAGTRSGRQQRGTPLPAAAAPPSQQTCEPASTPIG